MNNSSDLAAAIDFGISNTDVVVRRGGELYTWSQRYQTDPDEASVRALVEVVTEASRPDVADDLVILVGHNPGLAGLVQYAGAASAPKDEATAKFPTAAVAVLECGQPLGAALGSAGAFAVTDFAVPRG